LPLIDRPVWIVLAALTNTHLHSSQDGNASQVCGVLLVDDEKPFLELLAELLSTNLTCPVYAFDKPEEALKAAPSLEIGMLVTDYYMPAINGMDLIHRMQQRIPGVPAILITGHRLELTEESSQDLHSLRAVLQKPFTWRILAVEILRQWSVGQPPSIRPASGL
jgi:DNA-binding NtrC family response regulator